MAQDYAEVVDPTALGLLVVDAQRAFASGDSPIADRGVDVAAAVERVPNLARLLDACRDHDVPAFFTRSVRRPDGKDAPRNQYQVLPRIYQSGEPICCAGAPETDYVEEIEPAASEYQVAKRRYDPFLETSLESYLRGEGIRTLLIGGFTTNICVEAAARGAHERGFNVLLVDDACAAFTARQHEATLETVRLALGDVVSLDAALDLVERTAERRQLEAAD